MPINHIQPSHDGMLWRGFKSRNSCFVQDLLKDRKKYSKRETNETNTKLAGGIFSQKKLKRFTCTSKATRAATALQSVRSGLFASLVSSLMVKSSAGGRPADRDCGGFHRFFQTGFPELRERKPGCISSGASHASVPQLALQRSVDSFEKS